MGDTVTVTDAPEDAVADDVGGDALPKKKGKGGKKKAKRLRRRRQLMALGAAGALVAGGLIIAVVVLAAQLSDKNGQLSEAKRQQASAASTADLRASAASSARQYALDFSTYDYRHLDQDFAKVSAHLAPSFREQYASTTASLKSIVVQYRGVATASVQGVGVTSVTSEKAVVLVFLDQQVTNTTTKTPRIDRNRLEVTLQRSKDSWLLSDLQLK